jgi:hypothetical protein
MRSVVTASTNCLGRQATDSAREPEQLGSGVTVKGRHTAYLVGFHAPATDRDFYPLLVLDAVPTGAKGPNAWASWNAPPAEHAVARLVNAGLASAVSGPLPTRNRLYTISMTATDDAP